MGYRKVVYCQLAREREKRTAPKRDRKQRNMDKAKFQKVRTETEAETEGGVEICQESH